jgi:hypothetical protein
MPGGNFAGFPITLVLLLLTPPVPGHAPRLVHIQHQDYEQHCYSANRVDECISHGRYSHEHPGRELAALLHRGMHVTEAQQQVHDMIDDLLTEAAETGDVRGDIAPEELARYCLYALGTASRLPSEAAVRRLVSVTLAGLRPPR